ncbi:MAG: serine O-acetyltransferase [Promethearchaeia archaeon]
MKYLPHLEYIIMNKFLPCLPCRKSEEESDEKLARSCAECILNLDFQTDNLDTEETNIYLQKILNFFISDVQAAFIQDPAAKTLVEVLTSYPGIKAVLLYRIAHFFWKIQMPFIPRYISDIAREITSVEIHPGAEIGARFFIDHGAGVVVGETSKIGDNVIIYPGVVLGGTTDKAEKRHPTLGNNIIVGTGAKIIGNISIGDNVKIGANAVVVNNVPSDSVVVGVPGRVVSQKGERISSIDLRRGTVPDPLSLTLETFNKRLEKLERHFSKEHKEKAEKLKIHYGKYGGGI